MCIYSTDFIYDYSSDYQILFTTHRLYTGIGSGSATLLKINVGGKKFWKIKASKMNTQQPI